MENYDISFSPDFYIQKNTEYLHNMFVYVSELVTEFDTWANNNNMTMTTMKILHAIYYKNCKRQCDIVNRYKLPRTTVHCSIKTMVDCGIIETESASLKLTDKGIEIAKKIEMFFKELILKTKKIYAKDPRDIFKNFNTYAKIVIDGFTEKTGQQKKPRV